MFMQLGFALVETGFCRTKNALHVMAMNFSIYFLGMLGYFICGFAFQFGGIGLAGVPNLGGLGGLNREIGIPLGDVTWGLIGGKGFFLSDGTYDVGIAVMFLFQMVFMDTTATIPTGAMAERWKWSSFAVYGFFISTIIYPIFGNWAWGGGWLSQLGKAGLGQGYIDFAGSGVVHAVGGFTALAGAIVLGPRVRQVQPGWIEQCHPRSQPDLCDRRHARARVRLVWVQPRQHPRCVRQRKPAHRSHCRGDDARGVRRSDGRDAR